MSQLLKGLNDEQRSAVTHKDGPLLVVAGAGSGKTKALTVRIAYLMDQGVQAREILAITFTNKAAREMKTRVETLLEKVGSEIDPNGKIITPVIGTFHSIGMRILRKEIEILGREKDFTIFDTTDTKSLARTILKERNIKTEILNTAGLLRSISQLKNDMISPEQALEVAENYRDTLIAECYKQYQNTLLSSNAVDFDDLILLPVQIFQNFPDILAKYQNWWKYIMIDEYQDTNFLQYKFAQLLSQKHNNICAIGDSDQSIYKFRGADLSNILNFQKEYKDGKTVILHKNYRSTKNILSAADAVISQNSDRIEKTMTTDNEQGDEITIFELDDEKEEANIIFDEIEQYIKKGGSLSDIAILYRTNAQSRALEESALRHAIPYTIVGGLKFYARAEVKDILAYLRFIKNENDTVALERIINVPSRKIGKKSIDALKNFALSKKLELGKMLSHVGVAEGISPTAKKQIILFDTMITNFRAKEKTEKLSDFITEIIQTIRYEEMIEKKYGIGSEESISRIDNIKELISVARKYDTVEPGNALTLFLEEVALISDLDVLDENTQETKNEIKEPQVTLMTVHSSKGLEFPLIFMSGMEENIFPSSRSFSKPENLEEERRLMYVGMTRAEKKLYITFAKSRMLYGDIQYNSPSRFISEIPSELCDGNYFSSREMGSQFARKQIHTISHNFEIYDVVSHKKFGIGTILNIEGDILTITFQEVGEKRMVASIAPLTKVEMDILSP